MYTRCKCGGRRIFHSDHETYFTYRCENCGRQAHQRKRQKEK